MPRLAIVVPDDSMFVAGFGVPLAWYGSIFVLFKLAFVMMPKLTDLTLFMNSMSGSIDGRIFDHVTKTKKMDNPMNRLRKKKQSPQARATMRRMTMAPTTKSLTSRALE